MGERNLCLFVCVCVCLSTISSLNQLFAAASFYPFILSFLFPSFHLTLLLAKWPSVSFLVTSLVTIGPSHSAIACIQLLTLLFPLFLSLSHSLVHLLNLFLPLPSTFYVQPGDTSTTNQPSTMACDCDLQLCNSLFSFPLFFFLFFRSSVH